jgi:hypothetical protein
MSGIKIPSAIDSLSNIIFAKDYEGMGLPTPIFCPCIGCIADLVYVHGFKRESYGKTQFISSYFRLAKGADHSDFCNFKSGGNDTILAKDSSHDVVTALKKGENVFRVHILDSEDNIILDKKKASFILNPPKDTTKRNYRKNGKQATYIKSINSLLEIYLYGINNPASRGKIILIVNGEHVLWKDFFYSSAQLGILKRKIFHNKIVKAAVIATVHVIGFPSSQHNNFRHIECYPQKHKNGSGTYPVIKLSRSMSHNIFQPNVKILFYGAFSIPSTKDRIVPQLNGYEIRTIVSSENQIIEV